MLIPFNLFQAMCVGNKGEKEYPTEDNNFWPKYKGMRYAPGIVAVRLDILLNTNYVRDAVCIAFCVNELLSIVENTSLMGIPYPPAIKKAIEVLQKRAQHIDDDIQEMIDNMEDDKK